MHEFGLRYYTNTSLDLPAWSDYKNVPLNQHSYCFSTDADAKALEIIRREADDLERMEAEAMQRRDESMRRQMDHFRSVRFESQKLDKRVRKHHARLPYIHNYSQGRLIERRKRVRTPLLTQLSEPHIKKNYPHDAIYGHPSVRGLVVPEDTVDKMGSTLNEGTSIHIHDHPLHATVYE